MELRTARVPIAPPTDDWLNIRYQAEWNNAHQSDGVFKLWLDDQLVVDWRDVLWSDQPGKYADGVWVGGNFSRGGDPGAGGVDPARPFRRLLDDVLIRSLSRNTNDPQLDAPDPDPPITRENTASFELKAVNEDGQTLETVDVGEAFYLEVYANDLRDSGQGVFAASLDVEYQPELVQLDGSIQFGALFPNDRHVGLTQPGVLDELGAAAGVTAGSPTAALLARVPMRATAEGTVPFTTHAADLLPRHETALFGDDEAVPQTKIDFGSLLLTIQRPTVIQHNTARPWDVNDDGVVSPLDALHVINALNKGVEILFAQADTRRFLDTSGDGAITALDALIVINRLNETARVTDSEPIGSDPNETERLRATDTFINSLF